MRYVAANDDGLIILTSGIGVFRSTDEGLSWNQTSNQGSSYNRPVIISGNNVYIGGVNNGGVFISTNSGVTWNQGGLNSFVYSLALNGNILYGGSFGVFSTTNNGLSWDQLTLCIQDVYTMVSSGGALVAGTNLACSYSTNGGASWNLTTFNSQTPKVFSLVASGDNVFAGSVGSGVVLSTNNGQTFQYNHPLTNRIIYSLAVNGFDVFAGTALNGVYKSTNFGTSFIQSSLNNVTVRALLLKDGLIFAGTERNGIMISNDNGATWIQSSLANQDVRALISNGNIVFAGTISNGVHISTNNGTSWTQTSLNNRDIFSLGVSGNNIFAGSSREFGFYVSNDNGVNWFQKNEGLLNVQVNSICIFNDYVYAGTSSRGIFKRPLNDMLGIQPVSNEIPKEYSLSQNYPNPFNPVTNVKFQIPKSGFVELKIYDALGREVTTLVNEQLNPGTYEIDWNASNYPSGVYYYKLVARNFSETKKMVLIK
ncbi:MAG: T9SS type A sorting domain-containing protein [Chlorobi bacterium]|nr:T9SS type A sorting domain-containing protein [Chlorobiota bacterium]MCI0715533.1 T9SS type A sorting domain-containing protein [Chlorobiota bacterium]